MEPRVSMSAYALSLVVLLALLAATSRPIPAAALGAAIFLVGALFTYTYRLAARGHDLPDHRRKKEPLVVAQWAGAGGVGLALGALQAIIDPEGLQIGRIAEAFSLGVAVGMLAVFVSSLADWYVILPRVGGLICHGPCEDPGGQRWKNVTGTWLLHRAIAGAVVVAVAGAIPAYLSATSESATETRVWAALGLLLAGGVSYINRDALAAFQRAFNPPVHVGDTIWVEAPDWREGGIRTSRRAYVVDVAVEGYKYKLLRDGRYEGPSFQDKGSGPVPFKSEPPQRVEDEMDIPCRDVCSGVNWYCRNNPAAYE